MNKLLLTLTMIMFVACKAPAGSTVDASRSVDACQTDATAADSVAYSDSAEASVVASDAGSDGSDSQ